MKIIITEGQFDKIKKFFNVKRELGRFQDHSDYQSGIDTSIVVSEDNEYYYIDSVNEYDKINIKKISKDKITSDRALKMGWAYSEEYNFPGNT